MPLGRSDADRRELYRIVAGDEMKQGYARYCDEDEMVSGGEERERVQE
jgi:hypothetical protein